MRGFSTYLSNRWLCFFSIKFIVSSIHAIVFPLDCNGLTMDIIVFSMDFIGFSSGILIVSMVYFFSIDCTSHSFSRYLIGLHRCSRDLIDFQFLFMGFKCHNCLSLDFMVFVSMDSVGFQFISLWSSSFFQGISSKLIGQPAYLVQFQMTSLCPQVLLAPVVTILTF